MIRLQRITTADTDLYSYMEKLMTQSFPSEEYRELEELRKYTDTKRTSITISSSITTPR